MKFDVDIIKCGIVNAYLIRGGRIALVDTVAPSGWGGLLKVLRLAGLSVGDIEFVLITHHHYDHCGNLARIRELSGATVIAGADDAPVIEGLRPTPSPGDINRTARLLRKLPPRLLASYQRYDHAPVDRVVHGGETIEELGLEVVALPGHTSGGVAYYDREGKRAFVGDMVSNYFRRIGMPVISASESVEEIYESQQVLAGLGLETAFLGHGRAIGPGASVAIAEFVRDKQKHGSTR